MSIIIHSTLTPKVGGFPVAAARHIAGAFQSVPAFSDLAGLAPAMLASGMLVYVVALGRAYRYASGTWAPDNSLGYTFTQAAAASSWTMIHNLGWNPSVTIIDSTGFQIQAAISYPSGGITAVAAFNYPLTGSGFLS